LATTWLTSIGTNDYSGVLTPELGSTSDSGVLSYSWDYSSRTLTINTDPSKTVYLSLLWYYAQYELNSIPDNTITVLDSSTPLVNQHINYIVGDNDSNYYTQRQRYLVGANSGYSFKFATAGSLNKAQIRVFAYTAF
jgi:hypothetical protein